MHRRVARYGQPNPATFSSFLSSTVSIIATFRKLREYSGPTREALGYDRMLKANTVKRRTHSLFRQGCMFYDWLPRMPEKYFEPLVRAFAENLMQQPGLAVVFSLPRK